MDWGQSVYRFYLNQKASGDDHVGSINILESMSLVEKWGLHLRRNWNSPHFEFETQALLVYRFQKARPHDSVHINRRPDHLIGRVVDSLSLIVSQHWFSLIALTHTIH